MVPGQPRAQEETTVKKRLLISAAFVSLGFGIAGIFLPLLPTTPFLLLSAYCFLKSSRTRYEWLVGHRIFGEYIADYIKHRAVPLRRKILCVTAMWLCMGMSAYIVDNTYATIALVAVGSGVTWHILTLRTLKRPKCGNLGSTRQAC